jgi:hypothetical protein
MERRLTESMQKKAVQAEEEERRSTQVNNQALQPSSGDIFERYEYEVIDFHMHSLVYVYLSLPSMFVSIIMHHHTIHHALSSLYLKLEVTEADKGMDELEEIYKASETLECNFERIMVTNKQLNIVCVWMCFFLHRTN